MENCRLSADARLIGGCAGIDVSSAVEQESGRGKIAVFRSHMQERTSSKKEGTSAGLAGIELGEAFIHECGIGVNQLRQMIESAQEHCHHSRRVVPGLAPGREKDL